MAKFYYYHNGQVLGPKSLIAIKSIADEVPVCEEGVDKWEEMKYAEERETYKDLSFFYIIITIISIALFCSFYGETHLLRFLYGSFSLGSIILFITNRKKLISSINARNTRENYYPVSNNDEIINKVFTEGKITPVSQAPEVTNMEKQDDSGSTRVDTIDKSKHSDNEPSVLTELLKFLGGANIIIGILATVILSIIALNTQSWQLALYALFVLVGAIQPGIVMLALARILENKRRE